METLAYPHMTLAYAPQSDPPEAIALAVAVDGLSDTLPDTMTRWFDWVQGDAPATLSSAGWMALLSTAIATGTWMVSTAAIAQTTGMPGNSGVSFTETTAAPQPAAATEAEDSNSEGLKPLPQFEIDRNPPQSFAQWFNDLSGGFLAGDGNFREDVRRPVNPEALPQQTQQNNAPPAATFGVPVNPTIRSAGPRPVTSGRLLRYGMRSAEVGQLQTQLRSLGFFQGRSDGNFGNNTLNAVKAFQQSRGLASDGVVGPNTRASLYEGAGSGGAPIAQTRAVPQAVPQPVINRTRDVAAPTTGSICDRYYTRIGHRDVKGAGSNAGAGGCRIPCVGNQNQNVVALQNRLKTLGYFNFRSTGYYGPITHNAVVRFQRANGLRPDGVAGPLTKRALGLNF
ncbi:MAG: peptidoglycan-binding protein [Cyanobacteria bacterium P01_H01_bin.130]